MGTCQMKVKGQFQSEKWTVPEKAKLDEYCIAFNDGGRVIWDNVEQYLINRSKIACQEEFRLNSKLALDTDHVNQSVSSAFFWAKWEDDELRRAVKVKRMQVGGIKNVINLKHVKMLFPNRTMDGIIMRIRHLKLRGHIEISQNEVEDYTEKDQRSILHIERKSKPPVSERRLRTFIIKFSRTLQQRITRRGHSQHSSRKCCEDISLVRDIN